jgi:uncharacterized repeat protein (TIGR01451 family)
MKRLSKRMSLALTTLVLLGAVPIVTGTPVFASLKQAGEAIAQVLNRPEVKLNLSVEKQVVGQDQQGAKVVSWKALEGKATVNPGDVLRYIVKGQNAGDVAAKKLAVTQPIPKKTVFVLGSATDASRAKLTYSIDNGKSFVEKPMVQVKLPDGKVETRSAPAEVYTHVRWSFAQALNPKAAIDASYQVKVLQ